MTVPALGVSMLIPAAAAGNTTCLGALPGSSVLQVIDLVSGADVTSSFDPYVSVQDGVAQLDANPSSSHMHIAIFNTLPGFGPVGIKFAVMTSLGSGSTTGLVAAPGVSAGDVVVRAWTPVTVFGSNGTDVTTSLAGTAPSAGHLFQTSGISTSDTTLVMLNDGSGTRPPGSFDFGVGAGGAPGFLGVTSAIAGDFVVSVLDMTTGDVLTANCAPYCPDHSLIFQRAGTPTINHNLFFLFQRHP